MSTLSVVHSFLICCTSQSAGQGLTLWNWADASAPTTTLDLHPLRGKRVFTSNPMASVVFAFCLIYISRLHNELLAYTSQRLLLSFLRLFESLLNKSCKSQVASTLQ